MQICNGLLFEKNVPSYVCATSQSALVLISFLVAKPRIIYTLSPHSAIIFPKRKLMNVSFEKMKYTCH